MKLFAFSLISVFLLKPWFVLAQPAFSNDLGMEFVYIHPGEFWMGSPLVYADGEADEMLRKVRITQGFYLQTTEVTRRQWKALMEGDPSSFPECGDQCPVDRVKVDWVKKYIEKLNARDQEYRYRLPTEAEWEYVASSTSSNTVSETRAGHFRFSGSDCLGEQHANYDASSNLPGCPGGEASAGPRPVASYPANHLGLFDLHGNVWELCADWYGEYDLSDVTDPTGPREGEYKVIRGGSWKFPEGFARSANRFRNIRDIAGFRLVAEKLNN